MSAPDLLERTRMALAEAGYPDAEVWMNGADIQMDGTVPFDVGWRAVQLARPALSVCLACGEVASETDDRTVTHACLADRPLVRDCGVTR